MTRAKLRDWLRQGGLLSARALGMFAFLALLVIVTIAALGALGGLIIIPIAMYLAYRMVHYLAPQSRVDRALESLWTGKVFVRAWGWLRSLPGKATRGSVDTRRLFAVSVTVLLLGSTLAVGSAAALSSSGCETADASVTYEEFRQDNATISDFETDGQARVEKDNTVVGVDADETFVRLLLENPNTYCTEFTIRLSDDVVDPATLGSVSATDSDVSADWRSVHDFETGETYTEVTVRVPGTTQATFAPSQLRVKTLAWTGDAQQSADGFLDTAKEYSPLHDDSQLERRTHSIGGSDGETVTVPLTHPNDSTVSVDDWQATYSTDERSNVPLSQDSSEPVYYEEIQDGKAIELHYSQNATVQFTANPGMRDRLEYQIDSFRSDIQDLLDMIPI